MINRLSNIRVVLFGISLFGYGIVGIFINDNNTLLSRLLTTPYRLVVLFLSIFVILFSSLIQRHANNNSFNIILQNRISSQLSIQSMAIFVFVLMYCSRMVYELIYNQNLVFEKTDYLVYWFLISLLTAVSFLYLNLESSKKYLFFSWILLATIVLLALSKSSVFEDSSFGEQQRMGSEGLNPISLGHYASSLIIISTYAYLNFASSYQSNKSKILFVFYCAASFSVGILTLIRANSRGPFLATAVCLILLFISNFSKIKDNAIFLAPLTIIGICSLVANTMQETTSILGRFINTENEFGNSKDILRPEIFDMSIKLIENNFILGSGLEIPGFGYPHNIIVESFLTTGIVGGSLFFFIYVNSIRKSIAIIMSKDSHWSWLSLLYIQEAIGCLFSGCIYRSPNFWYLLFSLSVVSFPLSKLKMEEEVGTSRKYSK